MQSMLSLSSSSRFHVLIVCAVAFEVCLALLQWFGQLHFFLATRKLDINLLSWNLIYPFGFCIFVPAITLIFNGFLCFQSCMNNQCNGKLVFVLESFTYILLLLSLLCAIGFEGFGRYEDALCPSPKKLQSPHCRDLIWGLLLWRIGAFGFLLIEPFKVVLSLRRNAELKYF